LNKKNKVLFIGSFKKRTKDGSVGGQMFACNTIINSELNSDIDWVLLDTTADSSKPSGLFKRAVNAFMRIVIFICYLLTQKFDTVLIFVADGWSFWEKGMMVLIAKKISKSKVILAPRSGFIVNDISKNRSLHNFIKKVMNTADVVICQSQIWKTMFLSLCVKKSENQFIVIENGVELKSYLGLDIRKNEFPTKTILYLAWVDKNKGIFDLMDAVIKLKENNFIFKLVIAGNGSDFDAVKKIIEENDLNEQVVLYGWAIGQEKYKLLEQSDIFVLPTHFDGYPNSLVEAMASGKACIATEVGSIPDIIEHNQSGLLVKTKDANGIYEALSLLIKNDELRYKISLNAREITIARNSIAQFVAKLRPVLAN
jgi:glycosyltransferase involved in cell wall biosynthesis